MTAPGRGRIPVYVRHVCFDLLDAAWGYAVCRNFFFFLTRMYCVGVWFHFVGRALLLDVVLCWVDCCFGSWVLLCLFCLLHVTPGGDGVAAWVWPCVGLLCLPRVWIVMASDCCEAEFTHGLWVGLLSDKSCACIKDVCVCMHVIEVCTQSEQPDPRCTLMCHAHLT